VIYEFDLPRRAAWAGTSTGAPGSRHAPRRVGDRVDGSGRDRTRRPVRSGVRRRRTVGHGRNSRTRHGVRPGHNAAGGSDGSAFGDRDAGTGDRDAEAVQRIHRNAPPSTDTAEPGTAARSTVVEPAARLDGRVVIDEPTPRWAIHSALGTTAQLAVADTDRFAAAADVLHEELAAIDAACSRFRSDSEISEVHDQAGCWVAVGPLLAEAITVALRAAELTNGVVDPTVGRAVRVLGYDRDFSGIDHDSAARAAPAVPAPGWWRVGWSPEDRKLLVPVGVELDLGATAKALAADRIAVNAAAAAGCGVLVGLGGDVRVAGDAPHGGWRLAVGDDHVEALAEPDAVVTIVSGAVATSGIGVRTWRRAGRTVHHIVDPRTGDVPEACWRTVSVAAATCVDANTASTAAIVMGAHAPVWLEQCRLPARLVAVDGTITTTAGWSAGTVRD